MARSAGFYSTLPRAWRRRSTRSGSCSGTASDLRSGRASCSGSESSTLPSSTVRPKETLKSVSPQHHTIPKCHGLIVLLLLVNIENKVGAVGFVSLLFPGILPLGLIKIDEETGKEIRDRYGMCVPCQPGKKRQTRSSGTHFEIKKNFT